MSIEALAKGRTIKKDLTQKHPSIAPVDKGESFIGKFIALSERKGDNGTYNSYLFETSKGDMQVRVGKDQTRVIKAGEVVRASGKSFDDIAGQLVLGVDYGIEYLGEAPKFKGRAPMRLFKVVELS